MFELIDALRPMWTNLTGGGVRSYRFVSSPQTPPDMGIRQQRRAYQRGYYNGKAY